MIERSDQMDAFLQHAHAYTDRLKIEHRNARIRFTQFLDDPQYPTSELDKLAVQLLALEKRLTLVGDITGRAIRNELDREGFDQFLECIAATGEPFA